MIVKMEMDSNVRIFIIYCLLIITSGMDSVGLNNFIADCPHRYALEFFLASVHNKCYKTLQCDSYQDYQNGNCHSKKKYQMGFWAKQQLLNDNNRHKYYMDTQLDCTKN